MSGYDMLLHANDILKGENRVLKAKVEKLEGKLDYPTKEIEALRNRERELDKFIDYLFWNGTLGGRLAKWRMFQSDFKQWKSYIKGGKCAVCHYGVLG